MAPLESSLVSEVLSIAVPNVIGYLLTIVNEVTNTIFIGHAGTETEQAAVGLAIMMQNCVAVNVVFGLLGALDTLVSQGYGAGERELCCMHLQRGRAISAAQLLWMVPLLWFTAPVLELLQQDAAVAAHAQAYNRATIPGLLFFFQFEAARKFLINFGGEVVGPAAITAAASVLHVGWSAFWVLHMRMGNAGAGLANMTTWVTQCAALHAYLYWRAPALGLRRRSALGVEAAGWRGWRGYLALGVPAMVQLCSDAWVWDLCALLSGFIGRAALAAEVDTMNFVWVWFMPVIGLSASAAALVGNNVGAGRPERARRLLWTCVGIDLIGWAVTSALVYAARDDIAALLTSDPQIQALIAPCLAVYTLAGFADSAQNVMAGGLRGLGQQGFAALVIFGCFWGVLLPLAALMVFVVAPPGGRAAQLLGIWQSFGAGTALAAAIFTTAIARFDFRAFIPREQGLGELAPEAEYVRFAPKAEST